MNATPEVMKAHRFPGKLLASSLCGLALFSTAWAQPHPATGVYERDFDGRRLVIELHVAEDGTVTGESRPSKTSPGYYFEGSFADGQATGFFNDPTTILSIVFTLEVHEDVLTWYVYPGSIGQPPDAEAQPSYYLRQPGPGPTEPLPAPIDVLLKKGRNDTVLKVGANGAELQLRDVRNFLEAALLAMREAGLEGALFPGRIYYLWVSYVTNAFGRAAPETQALMAASETWWPQLEDEWRAAAPAARERVAQDVLLMIFTPETVAGWLQEADDGYWVEQDGPTCSSLMTCVLRTFDRQSYEDAMRRLPCLSVHACPEPANRN